MAPNRAKPLKTKETSRLETTRRAIQYEFLRELHQSGFSFTDNDTEPRRIQARVLQAVNKIYHGRTKLKTNRQQVSDWVARVRKNNYRVTSVQQDYSNSSQNRRKIFENEQRYIRQTIREDELKCNEIVSVFSDKKNDEISVSESTVRRYLKKPFNDEPSMIAAKPKGYRVGGKTAHHNKCRRIEAEFWNKKRQDDIDGIWFADESKITFRKHLNRQIDIKWVFRGEACEANWYEKPTHPGQINLFLVQSINGIELYDIYKNNMNLTRYKELVPQIRDEINNSSAPFKFYMHDNAWKGSQPKAELNRHIGRGKWTQYMGAPCWKPHKTMKTPITKRPVRVPRLRCNCTFPKGPIHAAYNPKMNLVEETFAKIDRQMIKNQRVDIKRKKPWPEKGAGKERFWKRQLKKVVQQVNKDKQYFRNQYTSYKNRCKAFIKSRGKRLKRSKY